MTETPPSRHVRSDRRRLAARAGLITLAVALGGTTVLLGGAWLFRRDLAREAATGWLRDRGVESRVRIERLELDRVVASLEVGPAAKPDLAVRRIEIDYALTSPWSGGGFAAEPSRVRLSGVTATARWADGALSFGRLDPLIAELRKRPPERARRGPRIVVETARLDLATPYGSLQAIGAASIDDGRLLSLDARVPAARLAGGGVYADLSETTVQVRSRGGRLSVEARGGAARLDAPGFAATNAVSTLKADLPYPDAARRGADGRAAAELTLTAATLARGDVDVRAVNLTARLDGEARGGLETLSFDGGGRAEASAAEARAGGLRLAAPRLAFADVDLAAGRGGAGSATFRLAASAEKVEQGGVSLAGLQGAFAGAARFGGAATAVKLRGALTARGGAWTGLGRQQRDDPAELAALKRALGDVRVSAPAVALEVGETTRIALETPLSISPRTGGVITVSERGAAPLFDSGRGAFVLTAAGGDLPEATVQVARYAVGEDRGEVRIEADTTVRTTLDFGPARGATAAAAGVLTIGGDGVRFAPAGCVTVSAARLELGEKDVESPAGVLCPVQGPLLFVGDRGWAVRGRLREGRAAAPFLQTRAAGATGPVDIRGGPRGLELNARIESARLQDAAAATRFLPLAASGAVSLREQAWTADVALRQARRREPVAVMQIRHESETGRGSAVIRSENLGFAEGGLQPADLTPLAGLLGGPVSGAIDFEGRFDWTADSGSSNGRLTVKGLDFTSPLGPVTGLAGTVDFTSLAPLISAPHQRLNVAAVQSFVVLDAADVRFQLVDQTLKIEGGALGANGGVITLEPFDAALEPGRTWEGAVRLSGVGLAPIVEASAFKDKVDLDATVSGRLPFVVTKDGFRIVDGRLAADRPGRLSIDRAALTGVEAQGGDPTGPDADGAGGVQDFAYQALENLAFDRMDARVNSLPAGRLGVLFHVIGRHDPPGRQELRLTWLDLLRRRFLDPDRKLPLPTGTGVDLTLDSTLNLDQLLADWKAVNDTRSDRSEAVQPRP